MTSTRRIIERRSHYVLKKIREKHGDGTLEFVAVVCDNCGRTIQALTVEQLLPKLKGWYLDDQIGRMIDYCPSCRKRLL
jgi:hypothetical protein